MIDILKTIISDILTSLYQPFWFALILSILFMFCFKNYNSVKQAMLQWCTGAPNVSQIPNMKSPFFPLLMIQN